MSELLIYFVLQQGEVQILDKLDILSYQNFYFSMDMGVSIHWTGLLDWNTRLDYWTGVFLPF